MGQYYLLTCNICFLKTIIYIDVQKYLLATNGLILPYSSINLTYQFRYYKTFVNINLEETTNREIFLKVIDNPLPLR